MSEPLVTDEENRLQEDAIMEDITRLSHLYDSLCQQRHTEGAKEYGVITFLGNDVIRMMAEELADTSNYCRMQFIKLMLLQEMLESGLAEMGLANEEGNVEMMGAQAFKGTGEGWKK